MIIPADIHTHCQPEVPGEAIVNCFPETFVPQQEGWYSVGIHPWYITSSTVSLAEKEMLGGAIVSSSGFGYG